jgi:osmotically-inducible protein OsmY
MNRIPKNCISAFVTTLFLSALISACAGGPTHRSTGEAVDDGVVLTRVKTALISNEATKARQIDVEVYRGEVQLNGFVDSDAARAAANTTAKGVEGVTRVSNNLQIRK